MNSLPVELVDRILASCDFAHNERLKCRHVCRAFRDILAPKAFRRIRTSEFTRDAFDRLVNLSKTPMAGYVVEYEYKLTELVTLKSYHDVDPLIQLAPFFGPTTQPTVNDMAKALLKHHEQHLQQTDILGTFYDIISLSSALPRFTNLKSVVISRFDGQQAEPMAESFETATNRAFWSIIKALNKSENAIESFTIDSVYHPKVILGRAVQKEQLCDVLVGLKSFELMNMSNGTYGPPIDILWYEILGQTPNLQTLRIGTAPSMYHFWLGNWTLGFSRHRSPRMHWQFLRVLEMKSHAIVHPKSLVTFLGDHRKTLKELALKGFLLELVVLAEQHDGPEPDDWFSWGVVFGKLSQQLQLEKIVLEDLHIKINHNVMDACAVEERQLREWEGWFVTGRGEGSREASVIAQS